MSYNESHAIVTRRSFVSRLASRWNSWLMMMMMRCKISTGVRRRL